MAALNIAAMAHHPPTAAALATDPASSPHSGRNIPVAIIAAATSQPHHQRCNIPAATSQPHHQSRNIKSKPRHQSRSGYIVPAALSPSQRPHHPSESVMNPIWILCTQIFNSFYPIWAQYFDNGIFKCHLSNGFTDINLTKAVNRYYIST